MFETHPHNILKFCPKCGSSQFVPQDDNSLLCHQCGFRFFYNSASSVVAIIVDEKGRLLLTRRAFNPMKGTLDMPGGFVSEDESLEAALVREVKEELNADILKFQYFGSYPNRYEYSGITVFTNDAAFICTLVSYDGLQANDDVSEFMWVYPHELDLQQIGLKSIRTLAGDYIKTVAKE